ncbi:MAG: hypothetical protein FIA92_13950 [Chloroflexi bacterium]|nr:hypothetical protein [Chloroflexota bacterium]
MKAPEAMTAAPRRRGRGVALDSALAIPFGDIPEELSGARVIVLAGPVDSGKTTLVASVYELLQDGPFGGYGFAGSRTLMALEERCHEGRVASGLEVPKTRRTASTEVGDLIHLSVSTTSPGGGTRRQILVNDVTGERFAALVEHPAGASSMPVLARADRVQVVVDGAAVFDRATRDRFAYKAEVLARTMVDHAQLRPGTLIDAVVTKLDLMTKRSEVETAEGIAKRILDRLPETRRGQLVVTCARSATPGRTATGTGVDAALALWAGDVAVQSR